jgi:hypothetical protein
MDRSVSKYVNKSEQEAQVELIKGLLLSVRYTALQLYLK